MAMRVDGHGTMGRAAGGPTGHPACRDGGAGGADKDRQGQQDQLVLGTGEAGPVPDSGGRGSGDGGRGCGHGLPSARRRPGGCCNSRGSRGPASSRGSGGSRSSRGSNGPGEAPLQLAGAYVTVVELLQGASLPRAEAFSHLIFHTR